MDKNGFSDTKIIGYEHNWSDAKGYPVQLVSPNNHLIRYILLIPLNVARCNKQPTLSRVSRSMPMLDK